MTMSVYEVVRGSRRVEDDNNKSRERRSGPGKDLSLARSSDLAEGGTVRIVPVSFVHPNKMEWSPGILRDDDGVPLLAPVDWFHASWGLCSAF